MKPEKHADVTHFPPSHHSMLVILKQAFTVPKSEIEQREKEWKEQQHKHGRPKKAVKEG